jgi:hypothetical protein
MTLGLTANEAAALIRYVSRKLDDERYPPAHRLEPLESDPRQT